MAKTKVAKPKAEKLDYHLEVNVNDLEYKGVAKDLQQALTDFTNSPDYPISFKTRLFMKFGKGKELNTRTYSVNVARRLFNRLAFREMAIEILANKLNLE